MRRTAPNPNSVLAAFRRACVEKGLAVTHQRLVIYRILSESEEHPSPEMLYESVRKELPSISLATIYKNLKTFSDAGIIRQISLHHDTLRVDAHTEPHHHLVCIRCKSVSDLEEEDIAPVRIRKKLPRGFTLERISVELHGLCAKCGAKSPSSASVE